MGNPHDRLELHEVIKLAELLGVDWEVKSYAELVERLGGRKAILKQIAELEIDRADPSAGPGSAKETVTSEAQTIEVVWRNKEKVLLLVNGRHRMVSYQECEELLRT